MNEVIELEGQAAAQLIALKGQVNEVLKRFGGEHEPPCETVSEGIARLAEYAKGDVIYMLGRRRGQMAVGE